MPDATYQPKVYRKIGGDEMVVASGGLITVESGGDINIGGNSIVDELAALNGLDSTELGFLNGVSAGVISASKAVVANSAGAISNTGSHLAINSFLTATDSTGDTVRINSVTNTGTANSLIGFQSKPAQGASTAQNVIGCEISPRVNDTFALTGSGTLIGAHVDAYLKGTTGNIAGDVRGLNLELVTDDAATRTVSGNVSAIRVRAAFSGTITGAMVPIRIEKAEAQTNSQQWDAVLELPSTNAGVWNDDPGTELNTGTAKGYIKVLVNGNARYIALFEAGSLAD